MQQIAVYRVLNSKKSTSVYKDATTIAPTKWTAISGISLALCIHSS